MRFAIITCPTLWATKLSILTPPQIFSGEIPFEDISGWLSLRSHVVNHANRPAKPQPQVDIGRDFDDKLWSLIEECWSQEPSNRPTAANVSLRLGGVNGCLFNPAEMYKKEIADLTEELARERERSKAARQDLETELARFRNSLERWELEQVELKKDLDKERDLRKQVEKNADESKAARQDLETELANLRNSLTLARREISILRTDGPGLSPDEPMAIVQRGPIQNGRYAIKNRAVDIYWNAGHNPITTVYFVCSIANSKKLRHDNYQVNNHYPIIQVFRG